MKYKNLVKKIAAYICMATMVVSSVAGVGQVTASAEEAAVVEDIFVDGAVKDFGEVAEYAYNYGWLCEATSDYKYMAITYTGDITNLRLQFTKGDERDANFYWMDQTQGTHLTLVGEPVLTSEEGATVVVDIEASGINLDNFDAMDMHYGPGTLNIGYVRLSASADVTADDVMPEPEVPSDDAELEDMVLEGLVGTYAPEGEGYAYLAGADVNAAGYQYLVLGYKGDATAWDDFRIEVAGLGTMGMGLNQYDAFAVDEFGEAVPAPSEEENYVVIDLAATGFDITKTITAIHFHTTAGNGSFEITEAELWTPIEIEPLEDLTVDGLIKTWAPAEDVAAGNYAYLGGMDVEAEPGYGYLELTYKGDATAFDDFRMEFTGIGTIGFGANAYDAAAVTVDGTPVPAPTAEEQTVVIDLWATELDFSEAITAIHMHQTAGNGSFEITNAVLKETYEDPVDPSTLEDIILNGDESGMSKMIKKWTIAKPAAGDQYKYIGFATLKEPNFYYRYLILTYTGDIGSVRFEFAYVDENGNDAQENRSPFIWFNKEGQENYFVTANGSDIPLDGGKGTTIVIDLWESGIDLDFYNSVHMHAGYGAEAKDITFQIGMARLSTKADLSAVDVMPTETPTTVAPTTTEAPTTVAPTTTTKKVTPPKKTKVKKATKKKGAKKVKLSIKKVKGANGYKVQFSKKKKFTKKNILVTKIVKKAKVTVSNKKLKKAKKLFVRVKAYKLNGKKKVWAKKWSKAKRVTIKK